MRTLFSFRKILAVLIFAFLSFQFLQAGKPVNKSKPKFRVIAFYTGINDAAHVSYVKEANLWFSSISKKYNFEFDSTNNWNNLKDSFLENYDVVVFLDTRPDSLTQRETFQRFMENGGGFLGFHFSGFALTPSAYPQNWDWYHNNFLGSGQYKGNTWRPTSAVLRVENRKHPATKNLPETFTSAPNEWYKWESDLRENPDIEILISIDSSSFPLGTGPKEWEIWHSGYYPVVWTNKNYRMLYVNMGHNDIDYGKTEKELSFTHTNKIQNQLIIDGLLWLGNKKKNRK
jgi:hypothetical protein